MLNSLYNVVITQHNSAFKYVVFFRVEWVGMKLVLHSIRMHSNEGLNKIENNHIDTT